MYRKLYWVALVMIVLIFHGLTGGVQAQSDPNSGKSILPSVDGSEPTGDVGNLEDNSNPRTELGKNNERTFPAELRSLLDGDLDLSRKTSLPVLSDELIAVDNDSNSHVRLGLPREAGLGVTGSKQSPAQVIYEGQNGIKVEVNAIYGDGVRIITIINSPNSPTQYTHPLYLPPGVKVEVIPEIGNALLVRIDEDSNKIPVGYIPSPWAYDANGEKVPVSQIISESSITLTVDHKNAAYPVYADPTYFELSCRSYSKYYSTDQYLTNKRLCPDYSFYKNKKYWPVGTRLDGLHRNVERSGECSWFVDTGPTWDFQVACKAHDYCYDLIRERHTLVTKVSCDDFFEQDLRISCLSYRGILNTLRRELCMNMIPRIMSIVRLFGWP